MFRRLNPLQFFHLLGGKSLADDIRACDREIKAHDRRFSVRRRTDGVWRSPGAVMRLRQADGRLLLQCENGWIELHWHTPDCLRVRYRRTDDHFDTPVSYAVEPRTWPEVPFTFFDAGDAIDVYTPAHVCRIEKGRFRLALRTVSEQNICQDVHGLQWRDDGALRLTMSLHVDEVCYGLGERASSLNLRGKRLHLWNADPPKEYMRDTDPLYLSVPFYIGVHEDVAYGVFWDNPSRGIADLGASTPEELCFESETGELCYYLITGGSALDVVSRYTELTGRPPLPPLWALGYHQSRFSYMSQQEVLDLAGEFRARAVPCDVIHLDIHYMDGYRVFTWDPERFPDPRAMLAQLHDLDVRVVAILDPGVKVDNAYGIYWTGEARDVFVTYPDGENFSGAVWAGRSHFPDFTSADTRDWWAQHCVTFLESGLDGLWNDMCEPTVFTAAGTPATLPDYVLHRNDGAPVNHLAAHNIYGMQMARATTDGLQQAYPERRPFSLVRTGYAGVQRYAWVWTGDNSATWDHLRLSISMVLNLGLSGIPYVGPDIGGFNADPTPELFTRWLQAALLFPYFRNHAAYSTAPQEPWAYGQPYETINRLVIEWRYRLLPYLYSVVAEAHRDGLPVIRPVSLAEPDNPTIRALDDIYLVGSNFLAAPVLEPGAIHRQFYLPRGVWYDFWTAEPLTGGAPVDVPAPLEQLPLFVRAGAVIPLWPELQAVGRKLPDSLTLRVYPGSCTTSLYEDDGEGLGYLDGDCRWVTYTTNWDANHLTISRQKTGRYAPPYTTIRVEVLGIAQEPLSIRVDGESAPLWFYDDGVLEVTVDDTFAHLDVAYNITPADETLHRRPR